MNLIPIQSKVFKSEQVQVLENDINVWLKRNNEIDVVDTAVADNQFIILFRRSKTDKIDKAIELGKNIKTSIKEVGETDEGKSLASKFNQPGVFRGEIKEPVDGKGIHAPHIDDYYKDSKDS